jgi:hypothetical protein
MYYNIFVVLLGLAGYLAIKTYKAHETEREKAYYASKNESLSLSDSTTIENFCSKLCSLSITLFSDTLSKIPFSKLEKNSLGEDFKPQLCTIEYLNLLCNNPLEKTIQADQFKDEPSVQNINTLLGVGDFASNLKYKKWHKGMVNEINSIKKDNYLMVLHETKMISPEFNEEADKYIGGVFEGIVKVIEISSGNIVAQKNVSAKNDEVIYSKAARKSSIDRDLNRNLEKNLEIALNKYSIELFSKPLNQKETAMQE